MDVRPGISLGRIHNGTMIRVVGGGTVQESYAFRAAVDANLDDGVVVFDATQCDYLDSTFLGGLISIHKACEPVQARRFLIAAPEATRIKLFATSSLNQYFEFIDTCPQPLEELATVDVDQLDRDTLGRHVMRCHERLAERGGREASAFRSIADQLRNELGEKPSE